MNTHIIAQCTSLSPPLSLSHTHAHVHTHSHTRALCTTAQEDRSRGQRARVVYAHKLTNEHANKQMCVLCNPQHEKIDYRDNVYGFDFSVIKALAMAEPLVDVVDPQQV